MIIPLLFCIYFLLHRILTCGGKRVFQDDRHMKHCSKMFKEIEAIFEKLGFGEEVCTKRGIKTLSCITFRTVPLASVTSFLTDLLIVPIITCTQDVTTIYTCLAAVLHITNIDFVDASTIDETTEGAIIEDEYPLRIGNWKTLFR